MYLRNWISYDADFGLILEVINCTLTWSNKQEIDDLREAPPFLRSCHIYLGEIAMGQNMKYTPERFMQEIVLATADTIIEPIKRACAV